MFKVGDWVVRKADNRHHEWKHHAKGKFDKPLQVTNTQGLWLIFDVLPGTVWSDRLFDPTSPPTQKSFNLRDYL